MFHFHKWVAVAVQHGERSAVFGGGIPVTLILYRCSKCGKARQDELTGYWTLAQLNKEGNV